VIMDRYIEAGFTPISGRFEYTLEQGLGRLLFDGDGAALGPRDEIILVEQELTRPVALHIQGHVARAAFMIGRGDHVRKLVWVVREADFQSLWQLVENWRAGLRSALRWDTPPCDYWSPTGECLAISPPGSYSTGNFQTGGITPSGGPTSSVP
jgi:hypothetical protein